MPPLVPARLAPTLGGLWAAADRTVWAFGSPRARHAWWRHCAAVVQWLYLLTVQPGVAASGHAHLLVIESNGHSRVWQGAALCRSLAAVAIMMVGSALFGGAVITVAVLLAWVGVPGYVTLAAGGALLLTAFVPPFVELRYLARHTTGRGGRVGDGYRELRESGHRGRVVVASNFAAHPQKQGHGDAVMRAWLMHADAHHIAVVANADDEGLAKTYIRQYGFQYAEDTDRRLVVRLPAPIPTGF